MLATQAATGMARSERITSRDSVISYLILLRARRASEVGGGSGGSSPQSKRSQQRTIRFLCLHYSFCGENPPVPQSPRSC